MQSITTKELIAELEKQLDPNQKVFGFGTGFNGDQQYLLVLGEYGDSIARISLNREEEG